MTDMAEAPPAASNRLTQQYDLLRDSCGVVEQPPLAIIELSGEDRKGWLQGQSTNDVRQLDLGASTSFCLCEPTGQIVSICDIWSVKDRFLLTCPADVAAAVLRRVETMVVMEDVTARDLTSEFELISVQGPQATRALGALMPLPTLDAAEQEFERTSVVTLRSDRTGLGGWDVLVPTKAKKAKSTLHAAFEPIGLETFMVARLEAGRPAFGLDYTSRTMPPELGFAFESRHVNYGKGCYTGQEVLMRIHSRGHTNRTWVGLLTDDVVEVGSAVHHPNRSEAGVVTSSGFSHDLGPIAAAMVRNEIVQDREVVTIDHQGARIEAELRRMPLLRFE